MTKMSKNTIGLEETNICTEQNENIEKMDGWPFMLVVHK